MDVRYAVRACFHVLTWVCEMTDQDESDCCCSVSMVGGRSGCKYAPRGVRERRRVLLVFFLALQGIAVRPTERITTKHGELKFPSLSTRRMLLLMSLRWWGVLKDKSWRRVLSTPAPAVAPVGGFSRWSEGQRA